MEQLWLCVLVLSVGVTVVRGLPGASTINCAGSDLDFGSVNEGYAGSVEIVTGITAGSNVLLVSNVFPEHLDFLELVFLPGQTNATVTTRKELDAEVLGKTGGQLLYSLVCDDLDKFENKRTLKVEDLNDNTPAFIKERFTADVPEIVPVDTEVLRVLAEDLDISPDNNRLSYSMQPPSPDFQMLESGSLVVTRRLNYNLQQLYTFTVKAEDVGGQFDEAAVVITLKDIDNLNPYFKHNLYRASIPENESGPFHRITPEAISAQDGDTGINETIVYSITEVSPPKYTESFTMESSSGVVVMTSAIDREELDGALITVSIKAAQADDPSKAADSVVIVTVEDVNDNAPVFSEQSVSVSIPENSPVGVIVAMASVADADQGGFAGNLSIVPESAPFSVSADGSVRVKDSAALDRESHTSILFQVKAIESDPPNQVAMMTVTVDLVDQNDNSPNFTQDLYIVRMHGEQMEGMLLVQVKAEDPDEGQNGEITYSLEFGNKDGYFSINDKTGEISLKKIIPPMVDTILEFSLFITARDGGIVSRSSSAQVNIFGPGLSTQFTQKTYSGTIKEEQSAGVEILKVTFLTGSEVPPTLQVVTNTDKFAISSDGIFTSTMPLDYDESPRNYSVRISISDGDDTDHAVVEVQVTDINDNSPEFGSGPFNVPVPENLLNGTAVVSLDVTDKDEDGFSNGHFILTSDTFDIDQKGVVFLRGNATLDRETRSSYQLQVVAVDQPTSGLSGTAEINIEVLDYNDNSPQFGAFPDPLLVSEGPYSDAAPGEVHTFLVTDEDAGPNGVVTLSFPSPNPLFTLREDGTLLVVGPLDRETRDSYDIVILASDQGTPQRENFTTVRLSVADVNDNKPQFSSERYSKSLLVKDAKEGDLVLRLVANDHDAGNNSLITYSFSAGGHPFVSINSETGEVVLTSDLASVTKDTTLTLTALARDQGQPPLNSTAIVVINLRMTSLVEGLSFESSSYNFTLAENLPEGTTVGVVTAYPGNDINTVNYTLVAHTDMFSINAHGAIAANKELDKESQEWYILEVEAVDNRVPPTSATTMVSVQVVDENEDPEFVRDNYTARIYSIAIYKSPVVYVQATDPDLGDQGKLLYSLQGASPYFEVDGSSGLLYVLSAGDLAGQSAVVEVRATDIGGLYATTRVKVEVQGSVSSDVVVISLNQAANVVENKIPEVESTLGRVIGWTVDVIGVSNTNGGASLSRTSRQEPKTYVSFIAMDGVEVVSSEDVKRMLRTKSEALKAELETVFGKGLEYAVEEEASVATSDVAVIALSVLLAISVLVLMLIVVLSVVKFRRMKEHFEDPHREKFDIDRQSEGFTNTARKTSVTSASDQASVGRISLEQERRSWQEGLESQTGPEEGSTRGDGRESRRSQSETSETSETSKTSETSETGEDRETGSREAEGGAERERGGGASAGHLDEDIEGSVKDGNVHTSAL